MVLLEELNIEEVFDQHDGDCLSIRFTNLRFC
jgi:hypothetical protein